MVPPNDSNGPEPAPARPVDDERLERATDLYAEYRLRLDEGEALDLERFVSEYPMFADEIRELDRNERKLAGIGDVFGSAPTAAPTPVAPSPLTPANKKRTAPRRTGELVDHIVSRPSPFTRYSFERKVGQGSMGEVFRVWDGDLRRTLAMKILSRGFGRLNTDQYERTLTRFVAEAQVTSQLDHPSIVPVHDFGVSPDGLAYFTMKLVKGRELRHVIDELHAESGNGWTMHRVLGLVHKACEAMSYAHHKGVLHRDLKPTNVMVGRYGAVYVMDWGLARILGSDHEDVLLADGDITLRVTSDRDGMLREAGIDQNATRKGASVGTPAYMAPEQAGGGGEAIDERADVYGIGAILYHVASGRPPYTEPGKRTPVQTVLFKLQQGPPPSIDTVAPGAPAELRAIVRTAMARAPEARFQTMEQLANELAAFLEGGSGADAEAAARPRNLGLKIAVGAALVAAVAAAVGYALGSGGG